MGASAPWLLRLPSALAVALAAYLIYRAARRYAATDLGWIASSTFLALPAVLFAATDVRPYGFALLFSVISTISLVDLLAAPNLRRVIEYAIALGLTVDFHLMFLLVPAAHLAAVIPSIIRGYRLPVRHAFIGGIVFLLTIVPQLYLVHFILHNPMIHIFAPRPAWGDLLQTLAPKRLLVSFAPLALVKFMRGPSKGWHPVLSSGYLIPFALIALLPPMALFALSRLSPLEIFVPRYFLSYTLGIAILFAYVLSSISPRWIASMALFALFIVAAQRYLTASWPPRHTRDLGDWATAVAYADRSASLDGASVLIRSHYVESDVLPLTPIHDNPLFSQLTVYPSRAHLIPLATTFNQNQARQLDPFLAGRRKDRSRFLLIAMGQPTRLVSFIAASLGPSAKITQLGDFDGVQVIQFGQPPR